MESFNKRGSFVDIIFLVIIIFVLSILIIVGLQVGETLQTGLQPHLDNTSQDLVSDALDSYPSVFDGIFLTVLIFLTIFIVVTAAMIDTHPVLFILAALLLAALLFVGAILANTFEEIMGDSALSSQAAQFPITMFIMTNLPIFIGVIGALTIIALYAKMRQ
jgi:hypothetical protein